MWKRKRATGYVLGSQELEELHNRFLIMGSRNKKETSCLYWQGAEGRSSLGCPWWTLCCALPTRTRRAQRMRGRPAKSWLSKRQAS